MICTSFGNIDFQPLMNKLSACEMAEIRLDLMKLSDNEVAEIFRSHPNLIATCRPQAMGSDEQKRLLQMAIKNGAAFVDLEVESPISLKIEMMGLACQHGCRVIISYHNYECTPSTNELHAIINSIIKEGADIVKIATTVQTKADAARILGLYEHYQSLVALGMGDEGKITRIASSLLGAPFTFAAPNTSKTAPGQMTDVEMSTIYKIIEGDA